MTEVKERGEREREREMKALVNDSPLGVCTRERALPRFSDGA